MPRFQYERVLPYPREAVFDLVADVERYPEFLPGWREARILERRDNQLLVEQELGGMGLSFRFRTSARLDRPDGIRIETREHPFRHLDQAWRFQARPTGGSRVVLDVDYALGDLPLRSMLSGLFDWGFRQTIQAFEKRAREVFG